MLNTHNNLIDRNFQTQTRGQSGKAGSALKVTTERKHTLQEKVNGKVDELADEESRDDNPQIEQELQNYEFYYKVIRLDLIDDDYEDNQNNQPGVRAPNIVQIYQDAY